VGLDPPHIDCDLAAIHAGHGEIENDDFDRFPGEDFESGGTIESRKDFVACSLKQHPADFEPNGLIVDTQDGMLLRCHVDWFLPGMKNAEGLDSG
jgi:hypothetical protein